MKPGPVTQKNPRRCRRCGRFNAPHLCERRPPCAGTLCPGCCAPRSLPEAALPLFAKKR